MCTVNSFLLYVLLEIYLWFGSFFMMVIISHSYNNFFLFDQRVLESGQPIIPNLVYYFSYIISFHQWVAVSDGWILKKTPLLQKRESICMVRTFEGKDTNTPLLPYVWSDKKKKRKDFFIWIIWIKNKKNSFIWLNKKIRWKKINLIWMINLFYK